MKPFCTSDSPPPPLSKTPSYLPMIFSEHRKFSLSEQLFQRHIDLSVTVELGERRSEKTEVPRRRQNA